MAVPDFLALAESGLLAAVIGEWEISHDEETAVWGRAVVKGLKGGVILTNSVTPCTFCFRHAPNPEVRDVYSSAIAIHWGLESYATLEYMDKDRLKWRLPELPDGTLGSYTVWKRTNASKKNQVTKDVIADVRAGLMDELSEQMGRKFSEELQEARVKAADEVDEARSKAAIQIAAARNEAADKISELRVKQALCEELTESRVMAYVSKEIEEARSEAALSDELADARAKIADDIAVENESLREQLDTQVASSESLQDQLNSLRVLMMEMMQQSVPSNPALHKSLLEDKAWHPTGSKSIRQQEITPDKVIKELPIEKRQRRADAIGNDRNDSDTLDLPIEKRRRTDAVAKDSDILGWPLASCGA